MVTFRVPAMTRRHCASTIARAVASVDKDARIEISVPDRLVRVSSRAAPNDLVEALADAGYASEAVQAAPVSAAALTGGCCCGSRQIARADAGEGAAQPRASCC